MVPEAILLRAGVEASVETALESCRTSANAFCETAALCRAQITMSVARGRATHRPEMARPEAWAVVPGDSCFGK